MTGEQYRTEVFLRSSCSVLVTASFCGLRISYFNVNIIHVIYFVWMIYFVGYSAYKEGKGLKFAKQISVTGRIS
jgi:hypothetical protein